MNLERLISSIRRLHRENFINTFQKKNLYNLNDIAIYARDIQSSIAKDIDISPYNKVWRKPLSKAYTSIARMEYVKLGFRSEYIQKLFSLLGFKTKHHLIIRWARVEPYKIPLITNGDAERLANSFHIPEKKRVGQRLVGKLMQKLYNDVYTLGLSCSNVEIFRSYFPEFDESDWVILDQYLSKLNVLKIHDNYFLPFQFQCEIYIYNELIRPTELGPVHDIALSENINLDDIQIKAVTIAMENDLCCICGPGGTGKTTIIKTILDTYTNNHIDARVMAFTGKAVYRLNSANIDAMTIHMAMCKYGKNKHVPFDVVIFDESSMISSELLYMFMYGMNAPLRYIFVGDDYQLEPIGWGCPFLNLLGFEICPIIELKKIYRHSGSLMDNILMIRNQELPLPVDDSFKMIKNEMEGEDMINNILNDKTDFIILSPYNKIVNEYNKLCQKVLNPIPSGSTEIKKDKLIIYSIEDKIVAIRETIKNIVWIINDRVMMLDNNYGQEQCDSVMNGEEGKIISFSLHNYYAIVISEFIKYDKTAAITEYRMKYDGRLLPRPSDNYDEIHNPDRQKWFPIESLKHSWSLTIHKSQGSEWSDVVIILPKHNSFITNNMVYTAVARTKTNCNIITKEYNFMMSITNISKRRQVKSFLLD